MKKGTLLMEYLTSRIAFEDLESVANRLKSIAHPVRIAILDLLMTHDTLTVTEIQEQLKIEQTAASYHLIQMKNKKVVKSNKVANKMYYSIQDKTIPAVISMMIKPS